LHKCFDVSKDNKVECAKNDLYDASDKDKRWEPISTLLTDAAIKSFVDDLTTQVCN
jgi:hypothetical protein